MHVWCVIMVEWPRVGAIDERMGMDTTPEGDDLVTVEEGATRLGISERSVWELLRRMPVMRYRRPGHGKATFVRWAELEQAYRTPRPISIPGEVAKKIAA